MLKSSLAILLFLAGSVLEDPRDRPEPEARSVAFLTREVPRWATRESLLFLPQQRRRCAGIVSSGPVGPTGGSAGAADTTAWLLQPAGWDHNGGDGPSNDKRLARIAFTAALATAVSTEWVRDRSALDRAADRLALDQAADGSWPIDVEDAAGSPAAYSRSLATYLVRQSLFATRQPRFQIAIECGHRWLLSRDVLTVSDASVSLLASGAVQSQAAAARREQSLGVLSRGQSQDGGWGPTVSSPPEPFDTALALLGLVSCPASPRTRAMLSRGRSYLLDQQNEDGSWAETTRPPGNVSYAQRISTTGGRPWRC